MQNSYQAPKLSDLGSVEALTAGGQNGDFSDAVFPVGTPRGQLTFS